MKKLIPTDSTFRFACLPFLVVIASLSMLACGGGIEPATLVLTGGRVVTVDDALPEAAAVAVRGGTILAVGSEAEIARLVGAETKVIDLAGRLVIPGFIDSHAHFLSLGRSKMRLELAGAKSWDEVVAMVEAAAKGAKRGEWIVGRGWHQEKWVRPPEPMAGGNPTHHRLSEAAPENPVYLAHASGHAIVANRAAMDRAGLTASTTAPEGGEIIRDRRGEPTGVFLENAEELIVRVWSEERAGRSAAEKRNDDLRAVTLAEEECLSRGITTFCDAGSSLERVRFFRELAADGKLRVRLYVMLSEPNDSLEGKLAQVRTVGFADHHLTVRAIKRWIDGALGSHGAWLLEPYDDLPGSAGMNTAPIEEMRETARLAMKNGFQFCTHAIGDRANRVTLDIYEEAFRAFRANREKSDLRWRIEHAQHLHPDDIPRFARLGVVAAIQGIHCVSDGPWVPKRIGENRAAEGAYVWRKLIDSGALVCNGTDAPVEPVDPIACFHATVTRRLPDGSVFYGAQKMTRDEALRSYTIDAATACFEEEIKGSIRPGKLADMVVLSRDILSVPENEILDAEVEMTIVGGEVVYENR